MCVLTKAVYPAKFCQWDTLKMRNIEKVFTSAYKRITKNMRSFPDDLIYMAAEDGGIGMPSFTDRVFKETGRPDGTCWCHRRAGAGVPGLGTAGDGGRDGRDNISTEECGSDNGGDYGGSSDSDSVSGGNDNNDSNNDNDRE
jgi:hypothetical protein